MSFGTPVLLVTLLLVPAAVGLYLLAERRRMRYALRFTNVDVLATVAGGRSWRRYVPPGLFLLSLAVLCVALARPLVPTTRTTERATVILVVDQSGSMFARDVKPTRLAAAQAAVRSFLDRVPNRLRVGLVVFAAEPQVAAPPTTDRELLHESVDTLGFFPGTRGTAIGDALAAAVELGKRVLEESGVPTGGDKGTLIASFSGPLPAAAGGAGPVSILFLSDGSQTSGELSPLQGADLAKTAGIPVYTIALGTPEGTLTRSFGGARRTIPVPPDPATLQAVARTTGGRFFAARTAAALESAYATLGSSLGRTAGRRELTSVLVLGAAVLLVVAGVLSALWSPRLP